MPLCQLLSRPFFVWPSVFYPPEACFWFSSEICFQQFCRCSQDLWHKARSPESHFEIHNSTLHQFYTAHIGFAMNSHGTMYDGILGWSSTPTSYYSWISNPLQLVCTHFFRFPADQQTSRQVAQVNTRNCSASFFLLQIQIALMHWFLRRGKGGRLDPATAFQNRQLQPWEQNNILPPPRAPEGRKPHDLQQHQAMSLVHWGCWQVHRPCLLQPKDLGWAVLGFKVDSTGSTWFLILPKWKSMLGT